MPMSIHQIDSSAFPMPHWADRLFALLDTAQRRQSEPDLAEVVRLIGNALEVDVCSIYEFDADEDRLTLAATVGLNWQSVGHVSMSVDEGLVGLTAQGDHPVMVQEAPEHPQFKYFPEAGEDPFHSFLGVPMLTEGGELRGILVIQTIEPRSFTDEESHLLIATGEHVAELLSL